MFAEYKKESNLIQTPVCTFVIPYLFYTMVLLIAICTQCLKCHMEKLNKEDKWLTLPQSSLYFSTGEYARSRVRR